MAADYGCLPQTILAMPWVHLKHLLLSAHKRRQRFWKFQTALRNMEVAQNMQAMFGGGASIPATESPSMPVGERHLDTSTKVTINEQRDASDPAGAGSTHETGDSDDILFWVKMKAMGYPVKIKDNRLRLVS